MASQGRWGPLAVDEGSLDCAGFQMSGLHFMGVFTLFTLFTLFFDSAGWLFECKNSSVKVRGLLFGYSRRQAIHGGFSTISAISAVF